MKPASKNGKHDSFEIIEMAIDDLQTLTRAFEVVSHICAELDNPSVNFDEDGMPEYLIN